jgi:hypothetical protein
LHGASNMKRQSVVDDEGPLKICTFTKDISTLGSSALAPTCVIVENMNWNLMFSGIWKGAIATNIKVVCFNTKMIVVTNEGTWKQGTLVQLVDTWNCQYKENIKLVDPTINNRNTKMEKKKQWKIGKKNFVAI